MEHALKEIQSPISTDRPIDPYEPKLTSTDITQSIRVAIQYKEIIRALESAGFTITQETRETCCLTNKQGTANVHCIQNETTQMAQSVEIDVIPKNTLEQKLFSAEITKILQENKILVKDI